MQNFSIFWSGFPVTPSKLMLEARKYNVEQKIQNAWIPGYKWYTGFLKRHKHVSLRTPQQISRQKRNTTKEQLEQWFKDVNTKYIIIHTYL